MSPTIPHSAKGERRTDRGKRGQLTRRRWFFIISFLSRVLCSMSFASSSYFLCTDWKVPVTTAARRKPVSSSNHLLCASTRVCRRVLSPVAQWLSAEPVSSYRSIRYAQMHVTLAMLTRTCPDPYTEICTPPPRQDILLSVLCIFFLDECAHLRHVGLPATKSPWTRNCTVMVMPVRISKVTARAS